MIKRKKEEILKWNFFPSFLLLVLKLIRIHYICAKIETILDEKGKICNKLGMKVGWMRIEKCRGEKMGNWKNCVKVEKTRLFLQK